MATTSRGKIVNPQTGRLIEFGGSTYKRLVAAGLIHRTAVKKAENNVYLVVLVVPEYYSTKQMQTLYALYPPGMPLAGTRFASNISGTHGIKVGIYTSIEKAVAAANILEARINELENRDRYEVLIREFKLKKTSRPPKDVYWQGKDVYWTPDLAFGSEDDLLKDSWYLLFLLVNYFPYHGTVGRHMELAVYDSPTKLLQAVGKIEGYGSEEQKEEGQALAYIALPVDKNPSDVSFRYADQNFVYI